MMRIVLTLLLLLQVRGAWAEQRVAFIVGNSDYENTSSLANPVNDSRLIAETLTKLGFSVSLHNDLGRDEFGRVFSDFLAENRGADVTLFYFAGHGIQFEGENYLLGTDADLQSEFDIRSRTIALSDVQSALQGRSQAALVFIDACRDNPMADAFYARNYSQTRSVLTRGLAPAQSSHQGIMTVFAASPGQVAYDGTGLHSPFSLALARHLPTEDVEVLSLMKRVIRDVRGLTDGRQNPTISNDLALDVFLSQSESEPQSDELTPNQIAASEWTDFQNSRSPETLESFAERHEGTAYAALALELADGLRQGSVATKTSQPLPTSVPEWCQKPENPAQSAICGDPDLLALDERLGGLYADMLSDLGGAARGQALVEQRRWRLSRDACGIDVECIRNHYELRLIALGEFQTDAPPTAMVVRSVQEELNRLSCGAGTPDGVAGAKTGQALELLSSVVEDFPADRSPTDLALLNALRSQSKGVCSALYRAKDAPDLMAGTWRLTATCGPDSAYGNSTQIYRLTLSYDGDGTYSGQIQREDGWTGVVGAPMPTGSLGVSVVWSTGSRSSISLLPGAAPRSFTGRDHYQCDVVAEPT